MNEMMRKDAVRIPKIIRIDISAELAYRLKKMLDQYAKGNNQSMDGALASHIAHKMWQLTYKSKFSTAPSFVCLTGYWLSFCQSFIKEKLAREPKDKGLQTMLACINAGQEVRSIQ